MAGAFDKFVRGLEAGQQMQARAVDIERRKHELEQNKLAVKNQKWSMVFEDINNILSTKDAKLRQILKKRADVRVRELGLPVDPGIWDVIEDDSLYVPMSQNLAQIMGVSDPQKMGQMVDTIAPFFTDPMKFRQSVIQSAAAIEQQRTKLAQQAGESSVDLVQKLRKERNQLPITQSTQEVIQAYSRIQGVTRQGADPDFIKQLESRGVKMKQNAASDVALIFNFMKMLDPGSVVREGEQATARNARGVAEDVRNAYNMLLTGQQLTPEQRGRFINEAKATYTAQLRAQQQTDRFYVGEARRMGIDPQRVVIDFAIDSAHPAIRQTGLNAKRAQLIREKLKLKGFTDDQINESLQKLKSDRKSELRPKQGKIPTEAKSQGAVSGFSSFLNDETEVTNGSEKAAGQTTEPVAE